MANNISHGYKYWLSFVDFNEEVVEFGSDDADHFNGNAKNLLIKLYPEGENLFGSGNATDEQCDGDDDGKIEGKTSKEWAALLCEWANDVEMGSDEWNNNKRRAMALRIGADAIMQEGPFAPAESPPKDAVISVTDESGIRHDLTTDGQTANGIYMLIYHAMTGIAPINVQIKNDNNAIQRDIYYASCPVTNGPSRKPGECVMSLHKTLLGKWEDIETYLLQLHPEDRIDQADILINLLSGVVESSEKIGVDG